MVLVLVLAGGLAIGLATLAGAWLASRGAARRELAFGAAAGALLVIAGVHLLPDAWSGAGRAGIPAWAVPAVAAASFALAGLAARAGCSCQAEREAAGGAGAAGALTAHRLLEGAALALASSLTVAVALIVHALAEGLAAGTLLSSASRRSAGRSAGRSGGGRGGGWGAGWWLAAMCASPIAGAAVAEIRPVPAGAEPLLLAVAAGVLGQAARVSLTAAFRHVRLVRITVTRPAAAALIAAAVTALAVRGAG